MWSPALVTWYAGPGWMGWRPRSGVPINAWTNHCPQGQSCGTAVSANNFQNGRPVNPESALRLNVASGMKIEQPDITPNQQALLPGRVVPQPTGFANARPGVRGTGGAAVTSTAITLVPMHHAPRAVAGSNLAGAAAVGSATQHVTPAPASGVLYDPAVGRYVNNSGLPSPATQEPNGLDIHPVPLVGSRGGVSPTHAGQPPSRSPVAPTAAPQSHPQSWFYRSSPQPAPGSSAAPRSGGSATGGQATRGNTSSGGGNPSGAANGGAAGMAGASHSGGSGSAGPHH